jgi:ethanolamine ammonia-lyase small subunit
MTEQALAELIAAAVQAQLRQPPATLPNTKPDAPVQAAPPNEPPPSPFAALTSARIGVGRAGTRLRTQTYLQFRADHAAARDAVYNDVPAELLQRLGLPEIVTNCRDRDEFLTRPDLGREFPEESRRALQAHNPAPCDVLVYAADGLSSRAVEANLENILPVVTEGLAQQGLSVAKPFFVKYGRVASMDHLPQFIDAKVICVLIGERPGLGSAESMSAYLAYAPSVGMPEANRTVVSNIYSGGLNAVEAGAFLAELIGKIFKAQKSGVNLMNNC